MSDKLTKKELYDQGSKSCQQYSQLTMQIRTMALNIFIGYSGGVLVILANADKRPAYLNTLLIAGGLILILFALVLGTLNYHYSSAHNAVRDKSLVPIENDLNNENESIIGPWTAHKNLRDTQWKWLSWYGPFIALALIGLISLAWGLKI
ncbi:MAG: hypothetical protein ACKVT2_16220 [Saprospiraceae bacterium]